LVERKEEWINGRKYVAEIPNYNHTIIADEVLFQLMKYFNNTATVAKCGTLFLTKEDVTEIKNNLNKLERIIASKKAELFPVLAVYCDYNQRFNKGFIGVPALVVEILSQESIFYDEIIKKSLYEEYGVKEYWIIDPLTSKVRVFKLNSNKYELFFEYSFLEVINSVTFKGLKIDLTEIDLIKDVL
ncbi:MAG: Uma2 family endonuclease, partial [Romboutsia sp.]|uniref:Uma2 family endonuclease n=1 Tax=Romboutsia sp. TaxID=1965302 RepID=UPI003F306CA8